MTHSIDELILQRCVDGELTDHERAELLSRLHQQGSLDNWKTLALTFVEHQVFSKVFAEDTGSEELKSFQLARPLSLQQPAPPPAARPHFMHRRVRPWFSIAASLLVGMIVGVGGHFMMKSGNDLDLRVASQDTAFPHSLALPQVSEPSPATMTAEAGRVNRPVMNVHLTGLGTSGSHPVSVPVYSPEHWQTLQQQQRGTQSTALPLEVRQMLEAQGMQVDHQHHWYRTRLSDGREILVPTETMRVRHAIQ